MIVDLTSFGFKTNDLPEANYIVDVRFLNNPFYVDELRPLTGLDTEVIRFFENDNEIKSFIKELTSWLKYIINLNIKAKKEKVTIAIGCTGGQHRSPYVVENIVKELNKEKSISEISIYHRELKKYNVTEMFDAFSKN